MDPKKLNSHSTTVLRLLCMVLLLAGLIFGAVQLRKMIFTASSVSTNQNIGFVGDSVLGVGASKKTPYFFLRNFLEEKNINAFNFSQPALSAIKAQVTIAKSPQFADIDTFILLLGRSENSTLPFDRDLTALERKKVDPKTLLKVTEIAALLSTRETTQAQKQIAEILNQEADRSVITLLKIWMLSLNPEQAQFSEIFQALNDLPEAPQRFYFSFRRILSDQGRHEEAEQVIAKMLSRYGPSPGLTSIMAWHVDRNGCTEKGLDLFETSISNHIFDDQTLFHYIDCTRQLKQMDRRIKFLKKLSQDPALPLSLKLFANRGNEAPPDVKNLNPRQLYLNDLYRLEKQRRWTEQADRYLKQAKEEGSPLILTSFAVPMLIQWLLDQGKKVIFITYPNDVLPEAVEGFSHPNLQIIETKRVFKPYLSEISVSEILDDDFEHLSALGSCLLAVDLSRQLQVPTDILDPLTWCEAQR